MKYYAKKITPLISGSPEWVVMSKDSDYLVCWCTSGAHAALIAKNLSERYEMTDELAQIVNALADLTDRVSKLLSEGPY